MSQHLSKTSAVQLGLIWVLQVLHSSSHTHTYTHGSQDLYVSLIGRIILNNKVNISNTMLTATFIFRCYISRRKKILSNVFYCIQILRSCDGIWASIFFYILNIILDVPPCSEFRICSPNLKSALLETELIYFSIPRSSERHPALMYLHSKPKLGENTETLWLYLTNGPLKDVLSCWRCDWDAFSLSFFFLLIRMKFYHKTRLKCGLLPL